MLVYCFVNFFLFLFSVLVWVWWVYVLLVFLDFCFSGIWLVVGEWFGLLRVLWIVVVLFEDFWDCLLRVGSEIWNVWGVWWGCYFLWRGCWEMVWFVFENVFDWILWCGECVGFLRGLLFSLWWFLCLFCIVGFWLEILGLVCWFWGYVCWWRLVVDLLCCSWLVGFWVWWCDCCLEWWNVDFWLVMWEGGCGMCVRSCWSVLIYWSCLWFMGGFCC